MSSLSWLELLKFGMAWVRAAPGLWSARPAVGLIRAEAVRNLLLHGQPLDILTVLNTVHQQDKG